jgi:hypothetical protein
MFLAKTWLVEGRFRVNSSVGVGNIFERFSLLIKSIGSERIIDDTTERSIIIYNGLVQMWHDWPAVLRESIICV